MKTQELKILVVGAGGIGGITAAQISRAGYQVEVVDCCPGLSEKIMNKGLHVFGNGHEYRETLTSYSSLEAISEPKDIIILATKATALSAINSMIHPILKEDGVVVSLQNGICEDQLVYQFGTSRVIGCVVGFGATVHEPGEIEMTSSGGFTIGKTGNTIPNHLNDVCKVLSTVTDTSISNNIYGHLYAKLIINSCLTTLGAISGQTFGEMLSKRKIRKLFIGIIREAMEVAKVAGFNVEKYAGKLDFSKIAESKKLLNTMRSHMMIRIVGLKYSKLKSSSLQSLETGNKTEIDFLNGYLASKGKSYNIATPINDWLISMVKEIEAGKRPISKHNINQPSHSLKH